MLECIGNRVQHNFGGQAQLFCNLIDDAISGLVLLSLKMVLQTGQADSASRARFAHVAQINFYADLP